MSLTLRQGGREQRIHALHRTGQITPSNSPPQVTSALTSFTVLSKSSRVRSARGSEEAGTQATSRPASVEPTGGFRPAA